jgi:pilus assembly protein CpaE
MACILVVDDNADLLQMVRVLLEERGGHEVILSADGEDALAKATANPVDLAIVDVMMPGITGYEVCRRLRQDPSTTDIPIVILTARGQPVDRVAALEAGADEYIAKPVTMGELLDRVTALLARKAEQPTSRAGGAVALLGLRGGVGVTTVAVNLSACYARQAPGQICLVDLCPSSGHAALHLGMRPDPNWSALAVLTAAPSEGTVANCLMTHPAGIHLLAAPFVPVIGGGLSRDIVLATLSALRRGFATVVVDLPSVLTEAVMAVLETADVIGVVITADPPAIQTTVGTLQVLKPLASRIRLILNQAIPGAPPPVDALQRMLKQPFAEVIPFDPAQAQALGKGKPLTLSNPDSPLAQRVARLAAGFSAARPRPTAA